MASSTDTPAAALTRGLRELVLGGDRLRERLAGTLGLSVAELTALGHLEHHGDLPPRMLAERLSLTSGGITALVDRLERNGYLVRLPHPTDRRSLLLHLTPEGERVIGWVFEHYRATLEPALTPDDLHQQVADLLTRAGAALRAAVTPAPKPRTGQDSPAPAEAPRPSDRLRAAQDPPPRTAYVDRARRARLRAVDDR